MNYDFEISDGILRKYKGKEKNVVIPDGVTEIGFGAFNKCYMSSVRIPEGVTTIQRMAFYDCRNLVDIILPNSLKIMKEQAFCVCRHLNEITLLDSLTNAEDRMFDDCYNLDEITIFGELFDVTTDEFTDAYDYYKIAEDYGFHEDEVTSVSEAIHNEQVAELPLLLIGGKFDKLYMSEDFRCELIARVLKHQPTNRNFLNMVKAHIIKIIGYLPEEPAIIRYLLKNDIFTSDNIDECIRTAIAHNAHEMQVLLTEYKCQNIINRRLL
ncbi:MAG: leucine-rich repeat domain-containing protein [Oscillospiraceae bacterium]|nr:leucine-rich repeat domain-containing protein [Oscillospiraceae bacterium]